MIIYHASTKPNIFNESKQVIIHELIKKYFFISKNYFIINLNLN